MEKKYRKDYYTEIYESFYGFLIILKDFQHELQEFLQIAF